MEDSRLVKLPGHVAGPIDVGMWKLKSEHRSQRGGARGGIFEFADTGNQKKCLFQTQGALKNQRHMFEFAVANF